MADAYLRGVGTRKTPQSEPIPGSDQVQNTAGGFAFAVDDWKRLDRFLILGSEGGSYYADERTLTVENAEAVLRCIKADGERVVRTIVEVSDQGRAAKNDPAIFALAMAANLGDEKTRAAAHAAVPQVCRIGTHLYHFASYVEQFGGWGRGMRKAIGRWYNREDVSQIAYQAVKYRQRDGWSHADLLRLAHPKPATATHDLLFDWIVNRNDEDYDPAERKRDTLPLGEGDLRMAEGFERAQKAEKPADTVALIAEYGLPREALRTEHLTEPVVWEALLNQGMPITALIRNLANMTRHGLLMPTADATRVVLDALADSERLRKGRVHPIAVLSALKVYAAGVSPRKNPWAYDDEGLIGDPEYERDWDPVAQIVDALDAAFYEAFDAVEPTGKRHLLAIDVSGSMHGPPIAGVPGITPRVGASAMAMVTARSEQSYEVVAFSDEGTDAWVCRGHRGRYGGWGYGLVPMPTTPRQRLDDVLKTYDEIPMGGTDVALPMLFATEREREFDCITIWTDSETWAGDIHPVQALRQYREQSGISAKLIVVGMVSNGFTVADPDDAGMLDVVGFDVAAPVVMADFARGEVG